MNDVTENVTRRFVFVRCVCNSCFFNGDVMMVEDEVCVVPSTLLPDELGPFQRAMNRVFDTSEHRPADVVTVTDVLEHTDLGRISDRVLPQVARAWLDAAAFARERDVVPTFLVLARLVSAMGGPAAEHAEDLVARASAAGQLTTGNSDVSSESITPRCDD